MQEFRYRRDTVAKVAKVANVPVIKGYPAEDQLLLVSKQWRAPSRAPKTSAGVSRSYQAKTPVKSISLAGLARLATNWDTI